MPLSFTMPGAKTLAQWLAGKRELLPTELSTVDLRKLDAAVRARSVFSARMTNVKAVDALKKLTDQLLAGKINEATARAALQDVIEGEGYTPETGFPGDTGKVPPAEADSLRDLLSERRGKLILDTQESLMANAGRKLAGNTQSERWAFPAWELVRIFRVQKPRGLTGTAQDPTWEERFVLSGGELVDGRMIALKDDAVWETLGSSAQFDDGIDAPHPPYAFNSGMGWRAVPREECLALGLITGDELPEATEFDLNGDMKAELDRNLEDIDPALLSAARASLTEALAA